MCAGAVVWRLGVGSFGLGVIGTCEPPCGCWDLGPLEEQQMLLIAEPPLQAQTICILCFLPQPVYFRVLFKGIDEIISFAF